MDKRPYSVNADGTEICTIYIKDLTTDTLLVEAIPNSYDDVYGHACASGRYDHLKEKPLILPSSSTKLVPDKIFNTSYLSMSS